MRFFVEIATDNAAFDPVGAEVARILREIAGRVQYVSGAVEDEEISVRDGNGNKVGIFGFADIEAPGPDISPDGHGGYMVRMPGETFPQGPFDSVADAEQFIKDQK